MSNLTISDIAKMAGVSTTAVSFVLNDRPGVSDKTREKVRAIIRETGFTPNVHTRRLNLGKSFTINVVLRKFRQSVFNQFALETLSGIFTESKSLGYSIIFTFVDQMGTSEVLESVRSKDCDGVILYQNSDMQLIELLEAEKIPFVCVDSHVKQDGKVALVDVDYYSAAMVATHYLNDCGHRRIGFVGPEANNSFFLSTYGGWSDALKERKLMVRSEWVFVTSMSEEGVKLAVQKLLSTESRPTALFCAGDSVAVHVLRELKEAGLRVPDDISIMSIDDLLVSRYVDPPLSTMTFNKELLGEKAVRILYQIMQREKYEPVNLIRTSPIIRKTVKKI